MIAFLGKIDAGSPCHTFCRLGRITLLMMSLMLASSQAGDPPASPEIPKRIFGMHSTDLASFEKNAKLAKSLGATHIVITDDIPWAFWQLDSSDAYPAWFIYRPGLLKIFPPQKLRPYVDVKYSEKIARLLEERCRILRAYGLKGYYETNEPQVLPESFFKDYPDLRGPRVDQANRSRKPYFSPCTDQPGTLKLYREAIQQLVARCPEIEIFHFVTTDAGSGFCWAPALYPGKNGPNSCRDHAMPDRVAGFLKNLQQSAKDSGHSIEINIREISPRPWMLDTFESPMEIIRRLPRGLAINDREGPDGRPFIRRGGTANRFGVFHPVVGIPMPIAFLRTLPEDGARRLVYFGDNTEIDFYAELYKAALAAPPTNEAERWMLLRKYAIKLAAAKQGDELLSLWMDLDTTSVYLNTLDFGPMLQMGHLLTRWITRPMVPFPAELTAAEKAGYSRFLLQAKGSRQADNLVDVQAMDMYKGWGAKLLFQHVIECAEPLVKDAIVRSQRLSAATSEPLPRRNWEVLEQRLETLLYLLRSADNMVSYQAQLDRTVSLGVPSESDPVLGTQDGWDRADLMETARKEVDNTLQLMRLLERKKLRYWRWPKQLKRKPCFVLARLFLPN